MKHMWRKLGRIMYWVVWPGSWVYLRGSTRTRLLLLCGDELLLVENWLGNGQWNLPGGGLHKHEDPQTGLIREVFEETGITLDNNKLRQLGAEPFKHHGFSYTCYYFMAELERKPAVKHQRLEIVDSTWAARTDITSQQHSPDVIRALQLLDSTGRI